MEFTQAQLVKIARLERKYPGTVRVILYTRDEAIVLIRQSGDWESGDEIEEEHHYKVEYGQLSQNDKRYDIDTGQLISSNKGGVFEKQLYVLAYLRAKEGICAVRNGHLRAVGRRRERITERLEREAKKAREAGVKRQVQFSLIMS